MRPVDGAAERVFEGLARARGRRAFHPVGAVFHATVEVERGVRGTLFVPGTSLDAIVRFSRALGTPRGRGDFLGLALRIAGVQDLLLASSSGVRVARHLPLPAATFAGTTLSSLLPFSAGGAVALFAAHVRFPRGDESDQVDELVAAAATGAVEIALAAATPWGRWRRLARVALGERDATAAPSFDPWICDGGIVPRGRINAVRKPAYRGSRRGRGAAADPTTARGSRP